jgi:circadian clock protein KaiC
MIERLRSGHAPLDIVLGGGLPGSAINLIIGLPGTGKTMLAQQYAFGNASPEAPALYMTTASEPLDKLIRYSQGLSFFDPGAIGRTVFYETLGPILQTQGLPAVLERITASLRDRRPGIFVIDSFKALETYAEDALAFRRFVIDLAGQLSAMPTSSLWVGEYDVAEVATRPEFAIADSILSLQFVARGDRTVRTFEVIKLRGSGFQSGRHAYRLSPDGLRLYPRLAEAPVPAPYELGDRRQSIGIAGLNGMLGGGVWPGSTTLIAGPSGSGKTLTGMHFLLAGAAEGEPGILASLQENPTQLLRVSRGFGWELDGPRVELMFRSPVDVLVDEWVYDLLDTIARTKPKRVVIDSLSDLRLTAGDEIRFHEYIYSLTQRLSKLGVSALMTHELLDFAGMTNILQSEVSHLSDNLVLLRQGFSGESVERSVAILKTRGSAHDPRVRRYSITNEGLVLDDVAAIDGDGARLVGAEAVEGLQG